MNAFIFLTPCLNRKLWQWRARTVSGPLFIPEPSLGAVWDPSFGRQPCLEPQPTATRDDFHIIFFNECSPQKLCWCHCCPHRCWGLPNLLYVIISATGEIFSLLCKIGRGNHREEQHLCWAPGAHCSLENNNFKNNTNVVLDKCSSAKLWKIKVI